MILGRHARLGYGGRGFTVISPVKYTHLAYSGSAGDCAARELCGQVLILYRVVTPVWRLD